MCPSQNLESVLLAYLIKSQGWTRVGLVYSTDSAGVAGAREFQLAASALAIRVVFTGAFLAGSSLQDVYFGQSSLFSSLRFFFFDLRLFGACVGLSGAAGISGKQLWRLLL